MEWIVLEVGVRCLRPLLSLPSMQFKGIIFQFCGISEATELGEIVQNLTK